MPEKEIITEIIAEEKKTRTKKSGAKKTTEKKAREKREIEAKKKRRIRSARDQAVLPASLKRSCRRN